MRASIVAAAIAMLLGAVGVSSAWSRIAAPTGCGLAAGAPWTLTSLTGATRHGNRYYVYETNLACSEVKARVTRLTRMGPIPLAHVSVPVSTGERLSCLSVRPAKDIHSLRPRTAWGWCGTDVARVARLGVAAAAGTEFFWVTADRVRNH